LWGSQYCEDPADRINSSVGACSLCDRSPVHAVCGCSIQIATITIGKAGRRGKRVGLPAEHRLLIPSIRKFVFFQIKSWGVLMMSMNRNFRDAFFALVVAGCFSVSLPAAKAHDPAVQPLLPHCEVPCGIYDDQMRFQEMLEDTTTIAKSITAINEFASGLESGPPTGKGINQSMRWVTTKETHATNIQQTVAQYFLTQRIKPDNERYVDQLKAAHMVMVAAMKCKQDVDASTADNLKKSIYDLYRAYEGKEPAFEKPEK
jgi:nickel superoxide dismutase